jgi:C1A family cysteine protease
LTLLHELLFVAIRKLILNVPFVDSNSAIDWRDVGAVTSVHSQGNCGACWAITAIETVESASFLSTGKLYDLSETEVIVCTEDCQMCSGGWPQDAFEYVIKHNGVPLESQCSYDGDWLLKLTYAKTGQSDELE